jgi:ABC-type phosphate transport system substrate-binding protein
MTLFPQMGTTAVIALTFSGSALADDITGAGSTFFFPILAKWSGEYSAKTGTKLDYQPIGSGRGIVQIKASAVDFGASDASLKPEDLKNSDLGQFRSGRLASRTRQIYLRRADLRCRYCYPRLLASPHGKCRLPPRRSD